MGGSRSDPHGSKEQAVEVAVNEETVIRGILCSMSGDYIDLLCENCQ